MATATPTPAGGRISTSDPPPGTPNAVTFNGVPTVGALFFTTGSGRHYCTASVVDSDTEDLVITAAHCVYGSGYATHLEFVPGYQDGREPYGAWAVQGIVVASAWRQSHDPDVDFAFLSVASSGGRRIQRVTGGLQLGIDRGYTHPIKVIGYNDSADKPVGCATSSFEFAADQMEFYCGGYRDGTSGGPWGFGYDGSKGTGTIFGVIGGYEWGGDYDWASYSAVFGRRPCRCSGRRRLPPQRAQGNGDHRQRELAAGGFRARVQEIADVGQQPVGRPPPSPAGWSGWRWSRAASRRFAAARARTRAARARGTTASGSRRCPAGPRLPLGYPPGPGRSRP